MTDMEKKVMIRLCAKIVAETDLYEMDKEIAPAYPSISPISMFLSTHIQAIISKT